MVSLLSFGLPLEAVVACVALAHDTCLPGTDAGNGPAFNLSMGLCADLLLWLVEYRAMTIVQAEFVIRALGRLVGKTVHVTHQAVTFRILIFTSVPMRFAAFLRETAPLQSEQKALGVSEVADLVTERRDEITALVQAAADSRFKQAYRWVGVQGLELAYMAVFAFLLHSLCP